MTKLQLINEIIKFEEYKSISSSKLMRKLKDELESILNLLQNKEKIKENVIMNFLTDDEKIEFNYYLNENLKELRPDQHKMIEFIKSSNKLNLCYPTGCGKGYIMITDLFRRLIKTDENIITICSHRLMLNTQHLDDVFNKTLYLTGKIGFIFVGSCDYIIPYTKESHKDNKIFESFLIDKKLNIHDLINSTTNEKDINLFVNNHLSNNRKVVIISTYNSLDKLKSTNIDTIYYDEAHKLANDKSESDENQNKFEENYKLITSKNRYFFTATPKDQSYCEDKKSDNFLMNNEDIFGKREGLTFKEAVDINAIVKPVIHISKPIDDSGHDYNSLHNKTKFIIDSYNFHRNYQKSISLYPDKIDGKVLVKCGGLEEVWGITKLLIERTDYNIASAGSESALEKGVIGLSDKKHFSRINNVVFETDNRTEFLEKIKKVKLNDNLIILHDDIFTEGINIQGITSTMFISDMLPNLIKILQNVGRATRLCEEDRENIFNKLINNLENNKCIKPGCSVIIPFWNSLSKENSKIIEETIKKLVLDCNWGVLEVPLGTEKSKSSSKEELDPLNIDNKTKSSKNSLEDIQNIIKIIKDEKRNRFINNLLKIEKIKLYNLSDIEREKFFKEKIC